MFNTVTTGLAVWCWFDWFLWLYLCWT